MLATKPPFQRLERSALIWAFLGIGGLLMLLGIVVYVTALVRASRDL